MATHQLFIDLGMSGTKACLTDGNRCYGYACPPKVADLPPSELEVLRHQGQEYGGGLGAGAYLQWNNQAYALAEDAEGRPNKSTATLRKSTLAHLRSLGAVGEMAHTHHLKTLHLDIGIALPFEEYLSEAHELTQRLQETGHFCYRGQTYDLQIDSVKVLPEAAGLVLWRKQQHLAQQHQASRQNYVVLMIGHRDLSFLVFRQGKPPTGKPSDSEKLGYVAFLEAVAQTLCEPENPYLVQALLRQQEAVQFPDQPGKVFPLAQRRQEAEAFYWEQVRHHLSEHFAALDLTEYEVLIGGGTAATLLRPHLTDYLATLPGATPNWLPDLAQEMAYRLQEVTSAIDQVRFADCYGGVKWLATRAHARTRALQEVRA